MRGESFGSKQGSRRERTWSKIGNRILSNTLAQKLWLKLSPWNFSVSKRTCREHMQNVSLGA